jgi:hypothetical protein
MSSNSHHASLALAPLGAGDLIDRAIRLYRHNFWTFVWIAAPPILIGTLIALGWTMLVRQLFPATDNTSNAFENYFLSSLLAGFGNLVIWLIEGVATLVVMGGASRNFVRHLLFGELLSVKETYGNVRARLGGLIAASSIITFLLGLLGGMIFYFGLIVLFIVVAVVIAALYSIPFLAAVISIAVGTAILFATGWLFFLVASRFAYVPQVMLVEGLGVFAAIGRSTNLASGNVKRIYALFIFTLLATYAALLLLYIPFGWYAYLNGVETFAFNQNEIPAWYSIGYQVIFQASLILLTPVWMIGLCLLYVDERVRHEGYDIELMAARQLGEIPALPQQYRNPLQPALATEHNPNQLSSPPSRQTPPPAKKSSFTTLGLD